MSYRSNRTRKRSKGKSRKRSSSYKRSALYRRIKKCGEFMPYYYETYGYPKHFEHQPTPPVKSIKRSNGRKYPKSIHASLFKSCRREYKKVCRKFLAEPNVHPLTKRKLEEDSAEQHYVQDFCVGIFGTRKKPFKNLKHEKTKVYV